MQSSQASGDQIARKPKVAIAAVGSAAASVLVAASATLWCWHAAGPGLGLFLGTILVATIYTPPLVLADLSGFKWISITSIAVASASILVMSTSGTDISQAEWLQCSLILATYVFTLAGITTLLSSVRFSAPFAACITTVLGLLWLTWPVWLSHWMTQGLADWLTPANPLLAMNSVLKHLGTWDRAPIAYRSLTVLNQDVPYRLPVSIFPAVVLHLLIGAPGVIVSRKRSRRADA